MSRLGISSDYADLVAEMALEGQRMVISQVQVHSSVQSTPYRRFVQKDPSVILRALSASLELGVLITIMLGEIESREIRVFAATDTVGHAPHSLYCCSRWPCEACYLRIWKQFEALGAAIEVRRAVIVVGDLDKVVQTKKGPHFLVAAPSRLANILWYTKRFNLWNHEPQVFAGCLPYLDLGVHLDDVVEVVLKGRTMYFFAAAMTTKVSTDLVRVETHIVCLVIYSRLLCRMPSTDIKFLLSFNTACHTLSQVDK
ncbi:hypothetical protein ARMSODRAFT_1022615 [Armillaria solidipes]|uniref:Uncharacterized protein n=1 Tax=Armillaria solidipes TaxID=1076256 RepID=A0A2H3BMU7_9AGAR|nr:hypothetical protein ARMSODRAFT_1022615 [Armillaria solidipes]